MAVVRYPTEGCSPKRKPPEEVKKKKKDKLRKD